MKTSQFLVSFSPFYSAPSPKAKELKIAKIKGIKD